MLEYMSKENNYKLYMKLLKEYYGIELDEDRRIDLLKKEDFKNIFNSYLEKEESNWLKESLPSITKILIVLIVKRRLKRFITFYPGLGWNIM